MADAGVGRVAVVGAGIGGLTLAITLGRRGVPVTVYERAQELREVGAAVGLSANGLRLLGELGLLPALEDSGTEPTELVYRQWRTAGRLHTIPAARDGAYRARFGAPWLGIHRAAFQQALAAACPDGVLRLGCAVDGITDHGDRVELTLADGTRDEAALVVGADGVHSRTRALVDPDAVPVYTGTSGFRGLVAVADLPLMPEPDAFNLWLGPDAHVVQYPIGRAAETLNFLVVVEGPDRWDTPPGPAPAAQGTLDALLDGWHPAVRQLVAAVPQGDRWPLLTLPPMRRWSVGRVVLLGDAAHTIRLRRAHCPGRRLIGGLARIEAAGGADPHPTADHLARPRGRRSGQAAGPRDPARPASSAGTPTASSAAGTRNPATGST